MAITLDSVKPGATKSPKIEDIVKVHALTQKKFIHMRVLDKPWLGTAQHWLPTVTKQGEKKNFPKNCLDFDNQNDDFGKGECPYCTDLDGQSASAKKTYYINVIIRDLQDERRSGDKPTSSERQTGYISDIDSNTWTPVRVVRFPPSLVRKIIDLSQLNVHKIGTKRVKMKVSDEQYGIDIGVLFDKSLTGSEQYSVHTIGASVPLTDEEKRYLCWNLENPDLFVQESFETAKAEVERYLEKNENIAELDVDSTEEPKKKAGPKKKPVVIEEDEEDEEDEEEEIAPKVTKKRPPVEDDDDEEEIPVRRTVKKKPVVEDDDEIPVRRTVKKKPTNDVPWEDD